MPDHAPFCSRGCKDRDLLNWLGEGYRVPGPPADADGLPTGYIKGPRFGTATSTAHYARPRPGLTGGRTYMGAFGFRF